MQRYLLIAISIGAISVFTTVMLYEFGLFYPLAEKLATFYANAGFVGYDADVARGLHYSIFALVGFGVAWPVIDAPLFFQKIAVVAGVAVTVVMASIVLSWVGVFFEPFSSLIALAVSAGLGLAYASTEHGRRKRVLTTVLGGRASGQSWRELLDGDPPDFMEGRNREVTVLTVRVFNHAELRKKLEPRELIEMTNEFLRQSVEFLKEQGGYVDEASPECVRVYFSVIREEAGHLERACDAALGLRERLDNLNDELETEEPQPLRYGIALSFGEMSLGVYECAGKMRLSAAGEVIEFVRKLGAANGAYGSKILVSADVYGRIRESFALRPMEMIYDAGNDHMSEVYELLARQEQMEQADEEARQKFWEGVIRYREGKAEEALKIFGELQEQQPEDGAIRFFISRTQALVKDGQKGGADAILRRGHARVLNTL